MGAGGRDVLLSERALSLFPYAVECKSRASIAVFRDYEQACQHVQGTEQPLLVIKENGSPPLAVVSLEHFMELARARSSSL